MKKIFDNKFFKILFGSLKTAFFLLVILYLAFIIVQRLSGNKSIFGYRMFTVATGSMAGVYDIHDVIAVQDCDTDQLVVGDDVAYQGSRGGLEGKLVTHRIIRIEENENGEKYFVTKGVNAPAEDPAITKGQILGKVIGKVPIISPLNHIVKSQIGFFCFVFCPLVLVIVLEVLQTITDIQLEKNEIREISKNLDENKKKNVSEKEEKLEEKKNEEESSQDKNKEEKSSEKGVELLSDDDLEEYTFESDEDVK